MKKNKRAYKKIDTKIYIVFIAVVAIALFNAVYSSYTILKSQDTTQDIVNNSAPSREALTQLNNLVLKSKMHITNWVYLPSSSGDKLALKNINRNDYLRTKIRLKALMKQWSNVSRKTNVEKILTDFEELTVYQERIMHELATFDDYKDPMKMFAAQEILESEILKRSESIEMRLQDIMLQQAADAKAKQDQMLYQLNALMAVVFSIAILIIGSLFFAAFIISRSFIVPVMRVREIILEMSQGRLPEYRMAIPRNVVGEMLVALKSLTESIKRTSKFAEEIGKGNLSEPFTPLSNDDVHGHALMQMRNSLKAASDADAQHTWINEGLSRLHDIMRSTSDNFNQLLDNIIKMVVEYLGVQQSAIFLLNSDNNNEMHIQLGAYYGLNGNLLNSKRYELKEGLIGQAIDSNKIIDIENVTDPFFTIDMGIMQSTHCSLLILPLTTSGKVVGVLTVVSLKPFTAIQKLLLNKITEPVAASLFNVRANMITTQLLEESRKQTEELAAQEHELRTINVQLTQKSNALTESEDELRLQQSELQEVNNKLEEKARLLEERNIAVEDARLSLAFKAEQLEQSNKYKSAFLANMSHELRTPLNSILILAKILEENKHKTLSEKQVEHAHVIYKSGSDLLALINDILDLSKVEAGKVELQPEIFSLSGLANDMHMLFGEIANDRKINFAVNMNLEPDAQVNCDHARVEQIIKNLLSNALKFTEAGGTVNLNIKHADAGNIFNNVSLLKEKNVLAIEVEDNGIGIAPDKQALVFEAFKQADGSTSRKYGGTGLGLTICRELALLMGGEIQLKSAEGEGSTFTLFLPFNIDSEVELTNKESVSGKNVKTIIDDRNDIKISDRKVLIIEDDHVFAQMLVKNCRQHNIKAIVAMQGDVGMTYAIRYLPDAIILDMRLPVMDGWTILQQLKADAVLKQIPVHVISSMDNKNLSMEMGADSFTMKPSNNDQIGLILDQITGNLISSKSRGLAIGKLNEQMQQLLQLAQKDNDGLLLDVCEEMAEVNNQLNNNNQYRFVVVNRNEINTDWMSAKLQETCDSLNIPLVYFEENPDECLRELDKVLNVTSVQTEVADFEENTFVSQSEISKKEIDANERMQEVLKGKTVLLVDDDMRNIYSMTSTLENEGMNVICAMNGKEAIEKLVQNTHIDIVLMDIMMPEMNGYEAMEAIRKMPEYEKLPMIAVTAKAMSGDREKCIESGASDYITKPVNSALMLSVMQAWLYK
jgi:signal transduction histidine kinase/DNA-binding response OmpR family regulator